MQQTSRTTCLPVHGLPQWFPHGILVRLGAAHPEETYIHFQLGGTRVLSLRGIRSQLQDRSHPCILAFQVQHFFALGGSAIWALQLHGGADASAGLPLPSDASVDSSAVRYFFLQHRHTVPYVQNNTSCLMQPCFWRGVPHASSRQLSLHASRSLPLHSCFVAVPLRAATAPAEAIMYFFSWVVQHLVREVQGLMWCSFQNSQARDLLACSLITCHGCDPSPIPSS